MTVTWWSHDSHMMITWQSHDVHMIVTWWSHDVNIPLYLQDLVEFKEQHNVSLTTHNDEPEILTHSQLHSTLSSALGDLVDPACWTHSWVTRYSSVVRSRGIVAHKGYVHKWSLMQLLLLPVSFWYCKSENEISKFLLALFPGSPCVHTFTFQL